MKTKACNLLEALETAAPKTGVSYTPVKQSKKLEIPGQESEVLLQEFQSLNVRYSQRREEKIGRKRPGNLVSIKCGI